MVLWDSRHPHEAPACLVNRVEEGMVDLCQLGPKNLRRTSTPYPMPDISPTSWLCGQKSRGRTLDLAGWMERGQTAG